MKTFAQFIKNSKVDEDEKIDPIRSREFTERHRLRKVIKSNRRSRESLTGPANVDELPTR